jgi:hypothetical protein
MGGLILLVVLVLLVFGLAYGLYTRKGSGINQHPTKDSSDPVIGDPTKGKGPDEHETEIGAGVDQSEGSPMDQRGTQ